MSELPTGPIYVCTRNDALDDVVSRTPEDRRSDLVFLQNGYIEGWLESKGLQDNTQVLLFLAVTAKGADPIDGVTSTNPEGLTAATGKHASDFTSRLAALDLKCKVLDKLAYDKAMYEKMFWICTMMLVGAAKECKTVGEAGSEHAALVGEVVDELAASVEGVDFDEGVKEVSTFTWISTSVSGTKTSSCDLLRSSPAAPRRVHRRRLELPRRRQRVRVAQQAFLRQGMQGPQRAA